MRARMKLAWGAGLAVLLMVILSTSLLSRTSKGVALVRPESPVNKSLLSDQLGMAIKENDFPERFSFIIHGTPKEAGVRYTLNEAAQAMMQKLMGQYKPDYGAFVAMDARTGKILSMVSYNNGRIENENLTLRATFPSASIFKIVTASAAIDMKKAKANTVVPFNGAHHTLYKRNVETTRETRWTTYMTMRDAFARSVNVFFGKLGLFYVGPRNLELYAERFLFNHPIHSDIPVQQGFARISANNPWAVAEAASGFTRETTMSPMHGALIAAAIANDGVMMEPYLIDYLQDDAGETFYRGEPKQASVVVEPQSAEELRDLFRQTVRSGTSRKAFRQAVRRPAFDDIEFGGKTGSITGRDPNGKCDWFVGYGRYQDSRIAVAALTVNEKKWKVKSSTLASLYLQEYFRQLKRSKAVADTD